MCFSSMNRVRLVVVSLKTSGNLSPVRYDIYKWQSELAPWLMAIRVGRVKLFA